MTYLVMVFTSQGLSRVKDFYKSDVSEGSSLRTEEHVKKAQHRHRRSNMIPHANQPNSERVLMYRWMDS